MVVGPKKQEGVGENLGRFSGAGFDDRVWYDSVNYGYCAGLGKCEGIRDADSGR
jgi:hypothetical protein